MKKRSADVLRSTVELSLLNCSTLQAPGGDLLPPMINSV